MIAGVNHTVEITALLLDCFNGAPEDSLSASTIVCEGMEEANSSLSVPSAIDYLGSERQD